MPKHVTLAEVEAKIMEVAASLGLTGHPNKAAHLQLGLEDAVHDHDLDYSSVGHNHNASYAPPHSHPYASTSHNHDASYSASGHTHTDAELPATLARDSEVTAAVSNHAGTPHGTTITSKKKAALESRTLTTAADVADLTHAVLANSTYYFRALIPFTTAAATTGIGLGVNGPANSTVTAGVAIPNAVAASPQMGVVNALDGNVQGTGSAAATPLMAVVEGSLTTGATAGTLAIRFRSEVASSAVNVLAGAMLFVWQ